MEPAPTRIFLVEDDRRLASLMVEYLEQQGFRITHEIRGDRAPGRILVAPPDLVILDLMLPGLDGHGVCREIRPRYKGPIMMLTASDEDLDQVLGLELGADDYVVKPVQPRVLLARIRALLRRHTSVGDRGAEAGADELSFGRLRLSPSSREVHLDGISIPLTGSELELLWLLANHAGEVLSREAILSRLRGIEYDGIDRSVDIAVSRLRRKLEQEPAHPVAIKTVRGRGELAVRATMPKRAPLRLLGETFNRMAERIQRLVESHRNLTNAVSHELRTPISRLRFGLEMLQRSDDPCDRQRYMTGMQVDVQELEDLVAELLAFSRLERDVPALSSPPRSVGIWLANLCERESLPEGVELLCRCDACEGRFDDRLLARAVANLLCNAGKYARTRVRVTCRRKGEEMEIAVEDDGPGVPDGERERIFEPFSRLDRSRDRETGGHGLGLAIVRRVMELHGGRAEVARSDLGGACFRLLWPSD